MRSAADGDTLIHYGYRVLLGAPAGDMVRAYRGHMRAADILLRRLWPERKGRPVLLDLPSITAPSDIVAALGAVADAVAAGEVSPEEGAAVAGILETQRRAAETVELERRIATLEQSTKTPA